MDNVYSTEENKTVVANTSPELPSNMSKRQFKKMQKMKKWLEQKDEKRLENLEVRNLLNCDNLCRHIFYIFKFPKNKSFLKGNICLIFYFCNFYVNCREKG